MTRGEWLLLAATAATMGGILSARYLGDRQPAAPICAVGELEAEAIGQGRYRVMICGRDADGRAAWGPINVSTAPKAGQ